MQIRGLALAIVLGLGVAAQPAPAATGFILGRVVDASTGRSVGGAAVTLQGAATGIELPQTVLADGDGNYLFHSLPAGTFRLFASAIGYLPQAAYGARRADGPAQPIELGVGQRIGDADIRLWAPASIAGTVLDDAGEPIANAQIGLLRYDTRSGRRRLIIVDGAATDERGGYRFARLPPATYFVWLLSQRTTIPLSTRELVDRARRGTREERLTITAMLQGGYPINLGGPGFQIGDALLTTAIGNMWVGPPPDAAGRVQVVRGVFYPGVPAPAEATAIALTAGERRTRVDLALRLEPSVRVSGVVIGPEGPVPNLTIRLVSPELGALESDEAFEAANTMTGARGEFTLLGVPAGVYRLDALRIPPPAEGVRRPLTSIGVQPAPTVIVNQTISVGDQDLANVAATARYGPRIGGRIEFQGAGADTAAGLATRARITLRSADGRSLTGLAPPVIQTSADGSFRSAGQIPGRYVLRVDDVPGWALASATVHGRDLADTPFEIDSDDIDGITITMTNRPSGIAGIVRTPDNSPDVNATLVVFAVDRNQWQLPPRRVAASRVSRTGTYRIEALPPGEYFVAAIDDAGAGDWQAPDHLDALSRVATRVTLTAGEVRSQDLRTVVVR